MICAAGPRTASRPTMGLMPMTGASVARSASRMPATDRMGATLRNGFDGAMTMSCAAATRGHDLVSGRGRVDAVEADLEHVIGVVALDEVVLEVEPAICRPDLGPDAVVGHGQQRGADAQRPRHQPGHRGQAVAHAQPRRAADVRAQVAIAEAEPGGRAIALEHRRRVPGLVAHAPASVVVGQPGERVHDRVEVRRDMQAVELEVVAGIDDDAQREPGRRATRSRAPCAHRQSHRPGRRRSWCAP